MSKTIVAFGELLWDVLPDGEVLGGAPANFAYRANSLGDQGIIVSRLGMDERGRKASIEVDRKGMQIDSIQWDRTRPTGTVSVAIDSKGHPEYKILPVVAYDFIETTPDLLDLARRADAICFGTLIQRSDQSRRTLYELLEGSKGLRVLDLNLRPNCFSEETIDESIRRSMVLKLNEDEAVYLARLYGMDSQDFAAAAVRKWRLKACIVTKGASGVSAASADEEVNLPVSEMDGEIVDTVGCGDAFTAAFVHHFLKRESLRTCCEAGNRLGAAVARTRGGMEPVSI